MKKRLLILLLLFLIICFNFVILAQDNIVDVNQFEKNAADVEKNIEKIENYSGRIEKISDWDYISQEWRRYLLQDSWINRINTFLTKFSIVFSVLFGEPYSFSLKLFFIIILWIYLFSKFSEILRDFSSFSSGTSWLIGFALTIIIAQLGAIKKIIQWLSWVILSSESTWIRVIVACLVVLALGLTYYFSSKFGKMFKSNREAMEKYKEKTDREVLHDTVEAFKKGLK